TSHVPPGGSSTCPMSASGLLPTLAAYGVALAAVTAVGGWLIGWRMARVVFTPALLRRALAHNPMKAPPDAGSSWAARRPRSQPTRRPQSSHMTAYFFTPAGVTAI